MGFDAFLLKITLVSFIKFPWLVDPGVKKNLKENLSKNTRHVIIIMYVCMSP